MVRWMYHDVISLGLDYVFVFFKQTTAYEWRISDWSSDVCSSDLPKSVTAGALRPGQASTNFRGARPRSAPSVWRSRPARCRWRRSEERRVGKEWTVRLHLGGRRIIKK